MNRYKFTEENIRQAIKFLKSGGSAPRVGPNWAKRFKDDLKVKGSKVFYKDLEVVPDEKIDDYLRDKMFKKDGTLPFGRDAAYHKLKTMCTIPRRRLMKFIKAQPIFEHTKAAVPKAKRKGGPKLKTYVVETDLIFIRKNDLVNSNPRFEKTMDQEETYILSSVEKTTGLSRLNFVKTKEADVVTPLVKEHIRSICKALKVEPKYIRLQMDKGGEFNVPSLKQLVPDTEQVRVGASVEKKNQDAQRVFYRVLQTRRSLSVPGALKQTQKLLNETFSRIQGASPNELVEKSTKTFNIKGYNKSRASYIAGDNRKPFEVGQRVRIQIKKDKGPDISFKSYKGLTFSRRVYIIKKITKTTPRKYWVGKIHGRWMTQDQLKSTETEDEKSKALIKERDEKQAAADKKEEEKQAEADRKRQAELDAIKEKQIAEGTRRKTRPRRRSKRFIEQKERMAELDAELQRREDELQKKKAKSEGVSPKRPRRKTRRRSKYQRKGEEEWVPGQ